ncbi:MAG: hypothetical protein ACYC5M_01595 [Anaerolineae bacterium]
MGTCATLRAPGSLIARLAAENRMLLALLRLGCSLQEAERVLTDREDPPGARAATDGSRDARRTGQ